MSRSIKSSWAWDQLFWKSIGSGFFFYFLLLFFFFHSVSHFPLFLFNDHKHTINCCHFPNGAEGMWQCHSFALQVAFHGSSECQVMWHWNAIECFLTSRPKFHRAEGRSGLSHPTCWGARSASASLTLCVGVRACQARDTPSKPGFWKGAPTYCAFTSYFWRELEVSVGKDLGLSPP